MICTLIGAGAYFAVGHSMAKAFRKMDKPEVYPGYLTVAIGWPVFPVAAAVLFVAHSIRVSFEKEERK